MSTVHNKMLKMKTGRNRQPSGVEFLIVFLFYARAWNERLEKFTCACPSKSGRNRQPSGVEFFTVFVLVELGMDDY